MLTKAYINITQEVKRRSKKWTKNVKRENGDASVGAIIGIVIALVIAGFLLLAAKSSIPKLWETVMNKITTTLNL